MSLRSDRPRQRFRWRTALFPLLLWAPMGLASTARAEDTIRASGSGLFEREHLLGDPGGLRSRLAEAGLSFEIVYTLDYLANASGGIDREDEFIGNLDLTAAWETESWLGRDLGTFFLYGLLNHGGQISDAVGDIQILDNIEAPDAFRLFEAWWQKGLFDDRASLLVGLYDVNTEFYVVESAKIFVHSSFGIGAAIGNSGPNGPSIFPSTSLGVRLKAEPVRGYTFQAAVLDGVPGDPDDLEETEIDLSSDDGALFIVELGRTWGKPSQSQASAEWTERAPRRRRVGRLAPERRDALHIALGAWLYTTRLPDLSRPDATNGPTRRQKYPGVYLIADFDASRLDPLHARGLSLFLQLGFADDEVSPFAGYVGSGFTYTGLLPSRPRDELGVAVAAAFNGDAFEEANRRRGSSPAEAEVAIEWTYLSRVTRWLTLQGDVQLIVNPGGLRDRDDAWVVGLRMILDL